MIKSVSVGLEPLSIKDIVAVARDKAPMELDGSVDFKHKINEGPRSLQKLLKRDGQIYGVTTGFGDSCTTSMDSDAIKNLSAHLVRFHTCGMGDYFSEMESRAIQATRLASLCSGFSGVRWELLNAITTQLNLGVSPRIPSEGSVGASGDLTPLSYLAASLMGQGDVYFKGDIFDTSAVYKELKLKTLELRPKEGLAVMNGTAVMTALSCLAFQRAQYLCKMAARLTSLTSSALRGNAFHFDKRLFTAKPHPGQGKIASWIRQDLRNGDATSSGFRNSARLQDRYSVRCAPHVIGVLQDALPFFKQLIETELNSANDNPLIDCESETVLHGGNFYGGHIAFAMDSMKNAVANVADLLDRQIALLMDPKFNNGLPANLAQSGPHDHGFKAVQIAASAWTAEALKLTMPASVFSRSTECHNQDKVSMGTISARDSLRVLQLTEQVVAAHILCSAVAVQLRAQQDGVASDNISKAHFEFCESVNHDFDPNDVGTSLETSLRKFTGFVQEEKWSLFS